MEIFVTNSEPYEGFMLKATYQSGLEFDFRPHPSLGCIASFVSDCRKKNGMPKSLKVYVKSFGRGFRWVKAMDYAVNDSIFSNAFSSHNPWTSLGYGVEMDLKQPLPYTLAAILYLRELFCDRDSLYFKAVNKMDPMQAFLTSCYWQRKDGYYRSRFTLNNNHCPFGVGADFNNLSIDMDFYRECVERGTTVYNHGDIYRMTGSSFSVARFDNRLRFKKFNWLNDLVAEIKEKGKV